MTAPNFTTTTADGTYYEGAESNNGFDFNIVRDAAKEGVRVADKELARLEADKAAYLTRINAEIKAVQKTRKDWVKAAGNGQQ